MGFSRRRFVECTCKTAGYLTMASAFRRFGLMNAYAQGVSDYRALVCVFLFGGNDGNNMIIPTDAGGAPVAEYTSVRGGSSVAITQANLANSLVTSLTDTRYGTKFGFHPTMPQTASLFTSGRIAVQANVGPLVRPTTRAQYLAKSVAVPTNLFSHSDQQNESQTSGPNSLSVVGWGGKIADAMQSANAGAQYPMVVSTAGSVPFANGNQTQPVNLVAQDPGIPQTGVNCFAGSGANNSAATQTDCDNRKNALQQLLTFDTGAALVQEASGVMSKSFLYTDLLNQARQGIPNLNWSPTTGLGDQLRTVAEIIQVQATLNLKRQIFFVSLGGFDTHSTQGAASGIQPNLLAQLDGALAAFYSTMVTLGMQDKVTTFTLSDFGRTLQPNTGLGTDHAWGNHQLIMGGAVQGQRIFGQFPNLALGNVTGSDDAGSSGRWIPTTSIDQFGATLAKWFGVADANLPAIFPNLLNFTTQDLGLLG